MASENANTFLTSDAGISSDVNFRSRPADAQVKRVYALQYEIGPTPRALRLD